MIPGKFGDKCGRIYTQNPNNANSIFMNKITLICAFFNLVVFVVNGQTEIPIIKANSEKAVLIEGKLSPLTWYLSPEAKPDIYHLSKSLNSETVTLKTDVDSISVMLKPGEQFDFIVLLNDKDSCHNRFIHKSPITKFSELNPPVRDTIHFELTERHSVKIPVLLNGKDSLNLMFDSNTSRLTLKEDAIIEKTDLLANQKGNEHYDFRRLPSENSLQIGNLTWENQQIFPTKLSGHGTDGRFGWDLFDGRIVEIDYENELFIVHSSLTEIPKGFSKFDMTFTRGYFHIEGEIVVAGKKIKTKFLVDSGYNRAILLDPILMKKQGFPDEIEVFKTNELRNGQGRVFKVRIFNSDKICFDGMVLKKVPTQILPEELPNPSGMLTHTLGNELLKRFNMILDFQNNHIYLKLNNLKKHNYTDNS